MGGGGGGVEGTYFNMLSADFLPRMLSDKDEISVICLNIQSVARRYLDVVTTSKLDLICILV